MKSILLSLCAIIFLFHQGALPRELGEPDLNSDEFMKRFTASYGVLSEKEPPLSDIEKVMLKKVAPIMRINKEHAKTFLRSMTTGEEEHSASFNYLLGNVYFENDEYLQAEEQYKLAIEAFPDFQRAWTNLGVLKLRVGDTKSALIALLKAVELGDSHSQTFGMLGFCHYAEGNYISAEVAYDRAVLAEPDNFDWLEGKAQTYLKSQRYMEAIRAQDELIARRPRNVDYWLAQTNAYLGIQDYQKAARNLEIARALGGDDFQSLMLLGNLYAKLGMDLPAAETFIAAAPLASEDDISSLLAAVKVLIQREQFDRAEALFAKIDLQESSASNEDLFDYQVAAAELAQHRQETSKAIGLMMKAIKMQPMDGNALVKLAKLYVKNGDRDRAYLVLDQAEHDPEAEYLALITRAKLLIEEERFSEAQTFVSRALRIESDETVQLLYQQVEEAARNVN
ncbi:tetratricopeptide repeat protein [Pelagicoccus sp. SDUM812003]|uniref:tetratricopeptide repeat protein n=1 Tax=Pelagicoccus sp. SDUM812003 TaxID=3041267 RepID=UPI00280C6EA2|nr:tetratricopeptide repeat protein [Pelagicoccus sp. SDUM812003]MDQ8202299.1 tetratricopeptide repeat protein [Pelagicoccus sp. SDUM812003]